MDKIVYIIIIIIIICYFLFKQSFCGDSYATIVYEDGERAIIPSGRWYINQDVVFSDKPIWCLPYGYGDLKNIAAVPRQLRHLTRWEENVGVIPRYKYFKYFLDV